MTPRLPACSPYLATALAAAQEASHILLHHYNRLTSVEFKGKDNNLVTIADKEAETRIREVLLGRFPEHTMLGEEGTAADPDTEFCWIVDPLDGTVNFASSLPVFSISIGLRRRDEMIAGVVYAPLLGEWFTAERGQGAWLNGERIRVSQETELRRGMLATGFPYDIEAEPVDPRPIFTRFLTEGRAIRRLGSAAIDMCYLACGRFDGYWEVRLSPWDMAAGLLIVEEAGGRVTDLFGGPIRWDDIQLLGTNGPLHEPMLRILREYQR